MSFNITFIDNPHSQLESDEAWDLLQKALRLRAIGYGKEYSKYVLPLSRDDFFSTQILIFDQAKLVCTYKFTRYDVCKAYRSAFPMIQALEDGGITQYSSLLKSIAENATQRGRLISYCGGWSIHPEAREDKTYSRKIRDMVAISHHHYMNAFNIDESMIFGVIKFKADQFQEYVGYERIHHENKKVGALELAFLDQEPVYMLHLKKTSDAVLELCKQYQPILDASKYFVASDHPIALHQKTAA